MDAMKERLIERGFPCHQVGAETQRERGMSTALPAHFALHVWWARRPLIPSRAAIVASLDSADTDPETFVRQLGIERVQALVQGEPWTLEGTLRARVRRDASGAEGLPVDAVVLRALEKEDDRRADNRDLIAQIIEKDAALAADPVLTRWSEESKPLPQPWPTEGEVLAVRRVMGDPAWASELIAFTKAHHVYFAGDAYGYARAFALSPNPSPTALTVLDPTAGGGSIPLEALRLGHTVIANELNPVASVILYATLDYPARFGSDLAKHVRDWGHRLLTLSQSPLAPFHPDGATLPDAEKHILRGVLAKCPGFFLQFDQEQVLDYIFARQVTCPHCGGEAPLLNTCWLSKEAGDPWGVRIVPDGQPRNGKVTFQTYRIIKGRGLQGDDPNLATVDRGVGQCVHCQQAIPDDEIKSQARGESPHGRWTDRLYCVVAVRLEPLLDETGQPQRYTSGLMAGEIKTRKVRFFRPPNECDLTFAQNSRGSKPIK
jgi:putative DNA methylase